MRGSMRHRKIRKLNNSDKQYLSRQLASPSSPLSQFLSQPENADYLEEVTDAVEGNIVPIDQWIVTPRGYLKGCRSTDGLRHPVRRLNDS